MVQIISLVTIEVTENDLIKRCEKEVGKECLSPEWKDYKDGDEVILRDNTAAILVEVSETSAQIRFYHYGSTTKFLKTVAPYQYKLHTAIIPWEPGLGFVCYGEDEDSNGLKIYKTCKIGIVKVAS
ncbi:hypothetical protein M441DRAFT_356751 [Trichoderma asperellum CBS 433.97]|uniref:Uncharacterized protein n=1 Tax=Trichoderma asperellum (strain ATCC 204424 / CBS 433.97 / NBRC 101777) TaxID=1042311 RepID=A0A2T3YR08_TRIA4|nr:hypothetical protein M441DRAFT_356751 [Trichoderma asperellum CBS 433.97]PTB34946.1 hypothetical protein M441DRAFT_356751 [Trichoderma asperellum CBS 433.97]